MIEKQKEEDEEQQQQNEHDRVYEKKSIILNTTPNGAYLYNQSLTTNTNNIINIDVMLLSKEI